MCFTFVIQVLVRFYNLHVLFFCFLLIIMFFVPVPSLWVYAPMFVHCSVKVVDGSTSLPGGNQVDGLPPA
jgi:hypothetical protein